MITFTSAELQRKLGQIQDAALSQPVVITRNGRERLVILSIEEYQRLKRRDRRVLLAGEFGDEKLEAIGQAEVPSEHDDLDDELKT